MQELQRQLAAQQALTASAAAVPLPLPLPTPPPLPLPLPPTGGRSGRGGSGGRASGAAQENGGGGGGGGRMEEMAQWLRQLSPEEARQIREMLVTELHSDS